MSGIVTREMLVYRCKCECFKLSVTVFGIWILVPVSAQIIPSRGIPVSCGTLARNRPEELFQFLDISSSGPGRSPCSDLALLKLLLWLRLGLPKKLLNLYKPCLYCFTRKPRCLVLHINSFSNFLTGDIAESSFSQAFVTRRRIFIIGQYPIKTSLSSVTNKWKYHRKHVLTHTTLCLFVLKMVYYILSK